MILPLSPSHRPFRRAARSVTTVPWPPTNDKRRLGTSKATRSSPSGIPLGRNALLE